MSLGSPDAIATSVIFGYVFDDDGTTPIENVKVLFQAESFQINDNLIEINEEVLSDATGLYQITLPQTVDVGVVVTVRYEYPSTVDKAEHIETIVVGTTDPQSVQDARALSTPTKIITGGPQGPAGAIGATGAPGTVQEQVVANSADPTELESLLLANVGRHIFTRQAAGASGADKSTRYVYDDNGPAKNAPYVMDTGDGGTTRWVAICGEYVHTFVSDSAGATLYPSADSTKLAGIEAGATADQTAGEIKTAYESNADTNEFSDAEQTKLAGIEAGAQVNVPDFMVVGGISGVGGTAVDTPAWGHTAAIGPVAIPYDGEIIAMSASMSGGRTAGTCTFASRINGVAQTGGGQTFDIDATNTTTHYLVLATPIAFSAGDTINIQSSTTGYTPTGDDATVTILWRRT